MKALVVNCSSGHYNLGAAKLDAWLRGNGWTVMCTTGADLNAMPLLSFGYDLVALSVIFSWHAPIARDIALRVKGGSEVWCGGPGVSDLIRNPKDKPDQVRWWERETGLSAQYGLDPRFDRYHVPDPEMTFAVRGCDVGCWFCNVWRIEGKTYSINRGFQLAPKLCDNNLSGMPVEYQQFIIDRYAAEGMRIVDCNSGFEPRYFDEDTYQRWRGKFAGPWRFAYDEMKESAAVESMMAVLRAVKSPRKKQVYVLVGNEPVEACYERAMQVIAWGGEPHCQYVLPLTWLGDPATLRPRHDWTYKLGRDFCRYFNRHLWRKTPIADYRPRINGPRPFANMAQGVAA